MIETGWIASVGPIVLGAGVGLVIRRVIAVNDRRRADAGDPPAPAPPPAAGNPRTATTLRRAVPAGGPQ